MQKRLREKVFLWKIILEWHHKKIDKENEGFNPIVHTIAPFI